tara:strand:+ start:64 stop:309 length:246 start_codon:yes stop_codon:yes gene_type:complete
MMGARDKRDTGGRTQGMRNIPGSYPLKALSRGAISEEEQLSENVETNYLKEEESIFSLNSEIARLIDNLQKRDDNNETKAQ